MSIFQKPPAQTLPDWLAIATRKLTDASKHRIQMEIEAHYAEAVGAQRADGQSESDAQASALAQLGDAHATAKRFRKRHLTEREEERLKAADRYGRSIWFLLLNYAMFWLFSFTLPKPFTHAGNPWLYLTVQSVFFIVIPTTGFVVARRRNMKANRHLLWVNVSMELGLSLYFYLMCLSVTQTKSTAFNVLGSAVPVLPWVLTHFLIALHTCRKIGRLGTISTDTSPPTQAVTS